ncbi:hypothetical protein AMTRI_Chr13g84110 [Amborella trichopoda]
MTPNELQERSAKRLCYNCNTKFVPGHQFKGNIGHVSATVLVDSGSTHNFMSEALAKKVKLQPANGNRFEVVVRYDVVLGVQWLRTLGPIVWDFARLLMKFNIEGKEVILNGVTTIDDKAIGDPEAYCYSCTLWELHGLRPRRWFNFPDCSKFWRNFKTYSRSPRIFHLHVPMITRFSSWQGVGLYVSRPIDTHIIKRWRLKG